MMAENTSRERSDRNIHPFWAIGVLLWMTFGLGVYIFNMLYVPGRIERLKRLIESLF